MTAKKIQACAKLNLFLEVTARREDGYHEISSVFQEVGFADELSAELDESGVVSLDCNDCSLPTDENNLVVKAALELKKRAGIDTGIKFSLRKLIPDGAGLGGGSSDAAAALILASGLWELDSRGKLVFGVAEAVGSDVPFFLTGGTCLVGGRGERLSPVRGASRLEFAICLPEWGVSTPAAYAAIDRRNAMGNRSAEDFMRVLRRGKVEEIAEASFNRFEEVVFEMEPRQGELQLALKEAGFAVVRMSGSGSAVWCLPPVGIGVRDIVGKLDGGLRERFVFALGR